MERHPLVLLANEPGAYRSLLATELPFLRPDLRVLEVNPADLEAAISDLRPAVVICSRTTESFRGFEFATFVLYPDGDDSLIQTIGGKDQAITSPRLSDILIAIDRVLSLQQS